jgi:fimbrial isopeptide formation D2 family protein/LPXTG-motif cell wall-anchored protein
MRHKKLLATALTLVMALALAAPAIPVFAAGDGSITITNPSTSLSIDGHTFEAYRIFELESYSGTNYAYKIDTDFAGFTYAVSGTTYAATGPNLLSTYLGTIKDDIDAINAFAAAVYTYITTQSITADMTATGSGSAGSETAVMSGLDLGYYLVYSGTFSDGNGGDLVAAHILTTTDPNANVTLKADLPTITKTVAGGPSGPSSTPPTSGYGAYVDLNTNMLSSAGDYVWFKLTSAVPNMTGYSSYTFTVHDTLSPGLSVPSSNLAVWVFIDDVIDESDAQLNNTGNQYYAATVTGGAAGAETKIEIAFDPDEFVNFTPGHSIEIYYAAVVNKDAATATSGNPNTAWLKYSNDPYLTTTTETVKSTVHVFTYTFDILKYTLTDPDENDEEGNRTKLAGATFELYKEAELENKVKFSYSDGVYYVNLGAITELVSDENGEIKIFGIDSGTYFLVETEAPDGYNLLTDEIEIRIVLGTYDPATGTLTYELQTYDDEEDDFVQVSQVGVKNNTGVEFPESGGIGRTIFTLVGLLLMLGAGVVLIARRKTAAGR